MAQSILGPLPNCRFRNRAYFAQTRRSGLRKFSLRAILALEHSMPDSTLSPTFFRSSLVTVSDVRCRPSCHSCGPEEDASIHGLVFPRTGIFVRHLSAKNHVVADPTRVLFFNRHETYRVSHPVPGGDDCTTVSFEEKALVDFLQAIDPSIADSPSRPFRSPAAASSNALLLRLHRLRQFLRRHGDADPLAAEEMCVSLLTESVASASPQPNRLVRPVRGATRRAHRDLVVATCVMLARRVPEKMTLAGLARAVFSSPFHLARIFRRETGMSLHGHRNRLRLRLAIEHLANGTPDLTMLALDLGFSSHAHFTHTFQGEFGCTPSHFRRELSSRRLREVNRTLNA
jgi:AraC family transcriptional regulator